MDAKTNIISDIMSIPGSSFRIQIEKKPSSALIRILRGLTITREVEIDIGELTKNRVVTIIQSELFMPISPFKIMKIVEELFKDIEAKEKSTLHQDRISESSQPSSSQETGLQSTPVNGVDEGKTC